MLSNNEIQQIVESAFQPYDCVAEFSNYDKRFGFRVYLPGDIPITIENLSVATMKNRHQLLSVISSVRSNVEAKGLSLRPWSCPIGD